MSSIKENILFHHKDELVSQCGRQVENESLGELALFVMPIADETGVLEGHDTGFPALIGRLWQL